MATGIPLPSECFSPIAYTGAGVNRVGVLTLDSAGYPSGVTTGDPTHTVGGAGVTEQLWPVWFGMDFCRIGGRLVAAVIPISLTGALGQLQVWQYDGDGNATTSQTLVTQDVTACTLVPLPDGTLDLFYLTRYQSNLRWRRSADGGQTWGAEQTYLASGVSPTSNDAYAQVVSNIKNTDLRGNLASWDTTTAPCVAYNPKGGRLLWNEGPRQHTGTRTSAGWDFQQGNVTSPAFTTFQSSSLVPLPDGSFVGGHVCYDRFNPSTGQWRTRDFIPTGLNAREIVFNGQRMVLAGTRVTGSAPLSPAPTPAAVAAMPLPFVQGGSALPGMRSHTGAADWHTAGNWTSIADITHTVRDDTGAQTKLPSMLWTGWPGAWFVNRNSLDYPDAPTAQAWTSFYPGRARWRSDGVLELLRPNATDGTLQFLRCRAIGGDGVARWEGDF